MLRVLGVVEDHRPDHRAGIGPEVGIGRVVVTRQGQLLGLTLEQEGHGGAPQGVLAGKVILDQGVVRPGQGRNLTRRSALESLFGKDLQRGLQQAGLRRFSLLGPEVHLGQVCLPELFHPERPIQIDIRHDCQRPLDIHYASA
ncbi:hypothetical protein D3C80_1317320 [compost metagenome]